MLEWYTRVTDTVAAVKAPVMPAMAKARPYDGRGTATPAVPAVSNEPITRPASSMAANGQIEVGAEGLRLIRHGKGDSSVVHVASPKATASNAASTTSTESRIRRRIGRF